MNIQFYIFSSAVIIFNCVVAGTGTMLSRKDDFVEPAVGYRTATAAAAEDVVVKAVALSEKPANSSANELRGLRHVYVRRTLLQFFDWRSYDWPMDCSTDEQCSSFGSRMACINKKCACEFKDYVLLLGKGCYPTANLFHHCLTSEQCVAMNKNSYCNQNKRCTCTAGYYFDGRDCVFRYDGNLKAQEVYKAAVVAAACFIVAVVGIFVACIVRRSFCRREANVQHSNSTSSDVFSVSDEIAALRAVDKPPSYEEVLQIERTFYGIPPPEYTFVRDDVAPPPAPDGQVSYPIEPNQVTTWQEVHCIPYDQSVSQDLPASNSVTVAAVIATAPSTCETSSQTISLNTTTLSPVSAVSVHDDNTAMKFIPALHSSHVSTYPLILHPGLLASNRSSRHHQCYTPPLLRPSHIPVPATCLSAPSSPHLRTSNLPSVLSVEQTPVELPTAEGAPDCAQCDNSVKSSAVEETSENQSSESGNQYQSGATSVAYDNPAFVKDHEK